MEEKKLEPRSRDIAHMWADKQVLRFFRSDFDDLWSRRLHRIYLALCEIDSDFHERRNDPEKEIHGLMKTISSYSGCDLGIVVKTMQLLRSMGLIDYSRIKDEWGRLGGSDFIIYKFESKEQNLNLLKNSNIGKTLIRIFPNLEKPYDNKNDKSIYYKNDSKESGSLRNSSKEELVPGGTPAPGSRLNRLSKGEKIRLKMLLDKDIPAPKPYKTPKLLPVVPQNIQSLIDSWNALGLRQHARPDTKLYKDLMNMLKGLLRGTLFKGLIKEYANRSFSEEEILTVFSSIKQAAIPANGIVSSTAGEYFKHVSLSDVIYNYRTKRSWFLNFFENPKNPLAQSVPLNDDPQPVVTNTFKRFYHKEVLGGASYKISNIEENKFRLGAKKTIDFLNANRNSFIGIAGLQDLASLVCDGLRDSVRDQVKDLEPGHFCSDRTFRKILPAYLHSQGLLVQ